MSFFPVSIPTTIQLLEAKNNTKIILDGNINDVITTIPVVDTSDIPASGFLTFEDGTNEVIEYTGKTLTTLTGCVRGSDGTTASGHADGTGIGMWWIAKHHNILAEEVNSICQNLSDRIGLHATQIILQDNLNANSKKLTGLAAGTTNGDSVRYEQVILANGSNAFSADQPMGTFKLTGLGAGVNAGDSVRYEQVLLLAGGTMAGNIAMGGAYKLTGLVAGSTAGDSVRYEQVLLLAGGTMAGNIAMGGAYKLTGLTAGTTNGDSVRYEQVVGVYLPLSGGTMAGNVAMGGSYKLTGLAAATANGDAVRYEQLTDLAVTNLIINGGFEEWATTSYTDPHHQQPLIRGWAVRRSSSGLVFTVSREGTNVDSGQYALKLDITTAPASKVLSIYQNIENIYALYKGKTLTISCRVKTSTAGCKLTFFDGSTTVESSAHTGGGGWETLSVTRTITAVGASATYSSVHIGYYASGSPVVSTTYIDSVMMSVSDSVVPYSAERPSSSLDRLPVYNFFVNGGFEIWQRGTGFTNPASGTYTADRWAALKDGGTPPTIDYGQATSSSIIDFGNGLYSMDMNITNVGVGATTAGIVQYLSPDSARKGELFSGLIGSIYTVSVKVKTTLSNIRIRVSDGSGLQTWYSQPHSGSGSFETLSVTFSPQWNSGSNITTIVGVVDGTVNQTGHVYFDSAILSYGERPVPYVPEDAATELMRCQRFYEKSYILANAPGTNTGTNLHYQTGVVRNTNDVMTSTISFKAPKASAPTVTLYTQGGTSGQWAWTNNAAAKNNRATTADQISTNGFNLRQQVSGSELFGEGHWVAEVA